MFVIVYVTLHLVRTERKKEPLSGTATPTQDSNHGDSDSRLITSQSIQSVVSQVKRRCRDFDGTTFILKPVMVLSALWFEYVVRLDVRSN